MCLSSCQSVWPTRLPRANIKNQFHHKGSMFSVNTMKLNSEFRTRDVTIVTPFSEFRYEANEKPWAKTRLAPSPLFLQPRKSFQQLLRCGWCTQRKAKRLGSRLCKNCLLLAWDSWQWTMGHPIEQRKENWWKLNRALTAPCISCLWRRSSQEQHRCGKEISFESKSSSARCKPHLKRAASCETPISGCGFALDAAEIPHVPRCLHGRLILR